MAVSSRDKAVNGLSLSRESSVKVLPSNKMSKYTKREVEGITPLQQNVKSGKAYIYGKRDVLTVPGRDATGGDDGSDSETVVEIKPRRPPKGRSHAKRERKQSSSQFIEEDIVAGETVQSMAIRYGCSNATTCYCEDTTSVYESEAAGKLTGVPFALCDPQVSEIRQLNNLYTDLDFYALKRVKIPVKSHSVLTETHEQEHRRHLAKERSAKEGEAVSSTDSDGFRVSQQQPLLTEDEGCEADEEMEESPESAEEKDYLLDREPSRGERGLKLKSAFRWKDSVDTMLQRLDEKVDEVRDKNSERRAAALEAAYKGEERVEIVLPPMGPSTGNDLLEHRLFAINTESDQSRWTVFFFLAIVILLSLFVCTVVIGYVLYTHFSNKGS